MNKDYRWMTPEEAARELKEHTYIWLFEAATGTIIAAEWNPLRKCLMVVGDDIDFWPEPGDRICRALVPEPPVTLAIIAELKRVEQLQAAINQSAGGPAAEWVTVKPWVPNDD